MSIGDQLRGALRKIESKGEYFAMRKLAHNKRENLVLKKEFRFVDKTIIKKIKKYSINEFGSSSFWPYLALYSEIREEFIPGWIPEDYFKMHLMKKYNPDSASLISGYKSFDSILFQNFSLPVILYTVSESIYNFEREKITIQEANKILRDYNKEVIIKPELGKGGKGIKFIKSSDLKLKDLLDEGDFIIQPVCNQHHELQKINQKSLNTLRVFTFLENEGNATVKFYYLKFGTGDSRLDNGSAGGGICGINEDGTLHENFYDLSFMKRGNVHPDTGVLLSDIKIPNIEGIVKACITAHESYPYVKFIGWDVAVGLDEQPILIEWNARYPMLAYGESLFGPLWEHIPR
jgi:hypothetical protein